MSYSQIFVCAFVIFQLKFLQALHTSITACHEAYHGASLLSLGSAVAFDRALEICNASTCMLKMTRGLYIMVAAPKHDLSISIICAVYYVYTCEGGERKPARVFSVKPARKMISNIDYPIISHLSNMPTFF